jgi:hypothetical protein
MQRTAVPGWNVVAEIPAYGNARKPCKNQKPTPGRKAKNIPELKWWQNEGMAQ